MDIISHPLFIPGFLVISITGILVSFLIMKQEQVTLLQQNVDDLRKSFNELDEQAKLILKTDLELNKAQEELDKRLNGLDALQKTSRLISTTLDESEIFHRIDSSLMGNLGFEKSIIFIYNPGKTLHNFTTRLCVGYPPSEEPFILSNLEKESSLITALKEGNTFSSINAPKQRREVIVRLFNTEHFVLSPILSQNGFIGIVFVGNQTKNLAITEGDEELVSILANQIGQSLENARLFEQVYRSTQQLESKIQQRTSELESAFAEVKQISKKKSEFISAVSHELRTPLTSIKGYAALLMTGKLGQIPDAVKERLEKINLHSDNLVKLINDLLDISRLESGKVEMNIARCNLKRMLENVHDLLTPQMKDKNISWINEIGENIPEMFLDTSQVERVFINLVGNAIKFTPHNGSIMIKGSRDLQNVIIQVIDNGIGINEEDLSKLFDEFYRVDNQVNQNVKGTGLGLSLAKKIVEAHDGKIWATSTVNVGTTFNVQLPIQNKKMITPSI